MSDLISRQDIKYHVQLEAMGNGQYEEVEIAYKNDIESLPSADAVQIPIKLEKRYPQSRDEDITDAFMRGYLAGRSSADRPTGWIPVSERLPEKDGSYLVCMSWNYHYMDVFMWADGWNCIRRINGMVDRESEIDGADIIAWMPLPKPYREVRKNDL